MLIVMKMEKRFRNFYSGDNCIVFENFTASIGDLKEE
jgi:hypothetical protein